MERLERLEQFKRAAGSSSSNRSSRSNVDPDLMKSPTKRSTPRGPLLGAHMSIAGGVDKSLMLGKSVDCNAIQIFTKSSRQWAAKPYTKEEIDGEDEGIKTIAGSLDEVHKACPGYNVKVTLEITAGQGSNLGYRFEQIARMIDGTRESDRLRVCFDTEHAFAAGYDIRTKEGYEQTFTEFDETIGVNVLAAFHLNDSKKEFNSRVDRHEHIGKGHIGVEAFRFLLNDKRFWGLPMCLETPKGPDLKEDKENLALLRSLIQGLEKQ